MLNKWGSDFCPAISAERHVENSEIFEASMPTFSFDKAVNIYPKTILHCAVYECISNEC